jgi:DNA-binding CsgD family transcriptional regulator
MHRSPLDSAFDPRVRFLDPSERLPSPELLARLEEIAEVVDDDPDVWVVLHPEGAPPGDAALALLPDDGEDPAQAAPRWLQQGYRAVLPDSADADMLEAAIRAVMAGLVVHPPASEVAAAVGFDVPELTPRELEVLELLAQGFSNREIGDVLSISSHTAKFHVQGLLDKLDATTRTEAAVRAARMLII